MPTSFTPLLGLALPATGELSGTWGDTVNNSITSLVESAVAGTTTLNTDADVTLTTNTGASNQARQAVLLCTGARTAQRTITAPAQSKTYIVVNNTTGGFSVKLVGSGPTAGITVDSGERALVVWNGSDFVKLGYASGVGVFTSVVAGSGTAALPSYSFLGDTDTGMFSPAANTLAWSVGGTDGVRLDSSGNLGIGVASPGSRLHVSSSASEIARFQTSGADMYLRFVNSVDPNGYIGYQNRALTFWTANVQCMSLDASGNLGLGVTPSAWGPAYKAMQLFFGGGPFTSNAGAVGFTGNCFHNGSNWVYASSNPATRYELGPDSGNHRWFTAPSGTAGNAITFTQAMTLTSAGLLQLAAGNTGGGVALNNAANTSPTVLDWYEEGTFTPTLTGIGTPTYTTQSGSYTRIGNVVHFNITLNWTDGTNGAGITVASLPFTAAGANTPVSVSVNYLGNASFTWTGVVKAYVSGGTANIALVVESSGASNGTLLNPSAGTKDVIISGTYRVA